MLFVVCHTNTFSASTFKRLMLIKAQLSLSIVNEDIRRKSHVHVNDNIFLLIQIINERA